VVVAGEIADKGLDCQGLEFASPGLPMLDVEMGPAFGPASQLRPCSHETAANRAQLSVSLPEIVKQGRSDQILPIGLAARHESCATQAMSLIGHRLV
jgi:hypothetical protein